MNLPEKIVKKFFDRLQEAGATEQDIIRVVNDEGNSIATNILKAMNNQRPIFKTKTEEGDGHDQFS